MKVAPILFIVLVGLFWVIFGKSPNSGRVEEERAYARSRTATVFNVVSGWNEKSGNAFAIALSDPENMWWETFAPCTEEQLMLRVGDRVRFEYNETLLPIAPQLKTSEYQNVFRKNCFLKIAYHERGAAR